MARYIMMTFSNAVEGREDEFNKWYDEVHIAELLSVPGILAAQRFEQAPGVPGGPARHLALYEIETENLEQTLGLMHQKEPLLTVSPAIDRARIVTQFYRVRGDRHTA